MKWPSGVQTRMERFNFEFLDKDSYFQQVIANAEDHSEERKQSTKVTPKKIRKGCSSRGGTLTCRENLKNSLL
jgi:hypothetical protein